MKHLKNLFEFTAVEIVPEQEEKSDLNVNQPDDEKILSLQAGQRGRQAERKFRDYISIFL